MLILVKLEHHVCANDVLVGFDAYAKCENSLEGW